MDSNDLKSIARVYTTLNEGFSQRLKARTSGTLSGLGHRIGGRAQELAGEFQQDTANLASKLSDSLTTSGEQRLEKGAAMRERGVAMGNKLNTEAMLLISPCLPLVRLLMIWQH